MFLRGMTEEKVMQLIESTLESPEKTYIQDDGKLVAIRNFPSPVGEMVEFRRRDRGRDGRRDRERDGRRDRERDGRRDLITRLTSTLKVVYRDDNQGYYHVFPSFPLIRKKAKEVRIIFPNSKIWPFSMIVS